MGGCPTLQLRPLLDDTLYLLKRLAAISTASTSLPSTLHQAAVLAAAFVANALPVVELFIPTILTHLQAAATTFPALQPSLRQAQCLAAHRSRQADSLLDAYHMHLAAEHAAAPPPEDKAFQSRLEKMKSLIVGIYSVHPESTLPKDFNANVRQLFYKTPPNVRRSDYSPFAEQLVASLCDARYITPRANLAASDLSPARPNSGAFSRLLLPPMTAAAASSSSSAAEGQAAQHHALLDDRMTVWQSLDQVSLYQRTVCKHTLEAVRDVGLWLATATALLNRIQQAGAALGSSLHDMDAVRRGTSPLLQLYVYGDVLGFVLRNALDKVGGIGVETQSRLYEFHNGLIDACGMLAQADRSQRLLACLPWLCPLFKALGELRVFPPYCQLRAQLEDVRSRLLPRMLCLGDRVAAALCGLLDSALDGTGSATANPRQAMAAPSGLVVAGDRQWWAPLAACSEVLPQLTTAAAAADDVPPPLDTLQALIPDKLLSAFNTSLDRLRTELQTDALKSEVRRINPEVQNRAERVITAAEADKNVGANLNALLEHVVAVSERGRGLGVSIVTSAISPS